MRRIAALILIFGLLALLLYIDARLSRPSSPAATLLAEGRPLPPMIAKSLNDAQWGEHVRGDLGLWVSVARQRLVGIRNGVAEFIYPCSTAAKGTGNREGSNQTPLGWHEIGEKFGSGLPRGAILVERKFDGKVWTPATPTDKDYVLTRVLWLRGLEPGLNLGPGIDSHERFIYIHGTPAEDKLGRPASMGCVRLSNDAVIDLFERAPTGTKVLITEW